MNRTFKIERDLSKYSKELNYRESERKIGLYSQTVRGRNLFKLRAKVKVAQKHEIRWNARRDAMKNTDWHDSDIFRAF